MNQVDHRPISVAIVDDHALFCAAMRELLSTEPDIDVVGEGRSGEDAVELAALQQPDVVLLDVEMPGSPSHLVIPKIRATRPATRVIVLTMHDDPSLVRDLMAVGARAYLVKNVGREQLFGAVRTVMQDDERTVVAVSKSSLARLSGAEDHLLTPRERDVLSLAAYGLTNSQIGTALHVAEGTVRRHLTNAYRKLDASGRLDAVNRAIAAGLISGVGTRFARRS